MSTCAAYQLALGRGLIVDLRGISARLGPGLIVDLCNTSARLGQELIVDLRGISARFGPGLIVDLRNTSARLGPGLIVDSRPGSWLSQILSTSGHPVTSGNFVDVWRFGHLLETRSARAHNKHQHLFQLATSDSNQPFRCLEITQTFLLCCHEAFWRAYFFFQQHGEPAMTPDEIIDAFSSDTFPFDAIAACRADKDASCLILLNLLKEFLNGTFIGTDQSQRVADSIFMVVHLLAEFREKRAFPLFMRLLGSDPNVENILGDATTETLPGVLVNTFDGNLNELHQLITNAAADEYVRASAIEALSILTINGVISQSSTQQFLKECFDKFQTEEETCFVWVGWAESIAMLCLESFVPMVEQAFHKKFIDPIDMDISDFHADLKNALNPQEEGIQYELQRSQFDNVDALAPWVSFTPKRKKQLIARSASKIPVGNSHRGLQPHTNPYRDVGRNDPCPCGSGKKFKKCCLE